MVLFFIQSLLIAANNRKLQMKLGWAASAIAAVIAVGGPVIAVAAPRLHPKDGLFGMTYAQFILPMFCEIIAFTVFVALGLTFRKKSAIHRTQMLLATLSAMSGATPQTAFFWIIYGLDRWLALFGPPITIALLLLVVRSVTTRNFDRCFAAGTAGLALFYLAAMSLAPGDLDPDRRADC